MDIEKIISLSLLEGLTEFIPVSSTGHLILLGSYFGEGGDAEKFFDVFIQLGAILAVLVLYFNRVVDLFKSLFKQNKSQELLYSPSSIIITCLPSLILGYLFYKDIKSILFYPTPVAYALIVGGIGLICVERLNVFSQLKSDKVTTYQALIIGIFQCFSLWPGMSRSGSCLIGARIAGVNRVLAAEFSFLVAIPIMFIAVGYDMLKNFQLLLSAELSSFVIGFILAFISGMLAVRLFISYLSRFSLVPFGIYRIVLGLLVLLFQ